MVFSMAMCHFKLLHSSKPHLPVLLSFPSSSLSAFFPVPWGLNEATLLLSCNPSPSCFDFVTQPCQAVQAGLRLGTLLPQPPKQLREPNRALIALSAEGIPRPPRDLSCVILSKSLCLGGFGSESSCRIFQYNSHKTWQRGLIQMSVTGDNDSNR